MKAIVAAPGFEPATSKRRQRLEVGISVLQRFVHLIVDSGLPKRCFHFRLKTKIPPKWYFGSNDNETETKLQVGFCRKRKWNQMQCFKLCYWVRFTSISWIFNNTTIEFGTYKVSKTWSKSENFSDWVYLSFREFSI